MSPNPFWNTYTDYLNTAQQKASSCNYSLWQMPVAYWQTVSSIMGLRSSCALTLQQAWAECCTTLATCKTPEQVAQCLTTYQQKATLCCTDLNTQTHKYRAELWHNWQVLGQRCTAQSGTSCQTNAATASATPNTAPQTTTTTTPTTTTSAPTPTYLKGWFVAGKTTSSAPIAAKTAEPVKAAQPEAPKLVPQPQPKQAPQPTTQETLPMAVGQSYSSSTPTVSSTADSVMRIGNAAASASAAATRRSVLARHTTRKSRLSRR